MPSRLDTTDPYRLLFPLGIVYALIGVGLWPLQALGLGGYPGVPHRELMMLGFEQAFVLGFILTAMPGLTHGERCRPWELMLAVASMLTLGIAILMGQPVVAAIASIAASAVAATALGRRVLTGRAKPPEEFLFIGLALTAGLTGAVLRLLLSLGTAPELPPRFAERLTSLGMVLPLVLGLGILLVPTFAGFRDPLVIHGIAAPHERRGRRPLYVLMVALLAGSFVADLGGQPRLGYWLRALPAWTLILLAWRPWRPGRAGTLSLALRIAGPLAALGMTLAALSPRLEIAGLHVTFIGGFALLTMAIGTRVVVSHGKQPLTVEAIVLPSRVLLGMAIALVLRVIAEWRLGEYQPWLVASASAWIVTWAVWGFRLVGVLLAPANAAGAPRVTIASSPR